MLSNPRIDVLTLPIIARRRKEEGITLDWVIPSSFPLLPLSVPPRL